MPAEKLIESLAASGAVVAVGTGVACDPVQIEYFTLNYIGVAFGALTGLLSAVFYSIKLYRLVQNKDNIDD